MSNLITLPFRRDAHWWTSDGEPRHDATLREARKECLFPSVTSVLSIKAKLGLENWKVGQLLAQAMTMTRAEGESDEAYIDRILAADAEERAKAPDLGTAVHAALAAYLRDYTRDRELWPIIAPVCAWIDEHVEKLHREVEVPLVNAHDGYAGMADLLGYVDGERAVIDWKTQAVKKKPAFYPEWTWQLAAYAMCTEAVDRAVSVIIDTSGQGTPIDKCVKVWEAGEVARGFEGFKGLLAAWKADRNYYPGGAE